jgi:hypothetical protein
MYVCSPALGRRGDSKDSHNALELNQKGQRHFCKAINEFEFARESKISMIDVALVKVRRGRKFKMD